MSLPTTPARSIAQSTLSTPSTARDGSPQELTPRSKVKALLAAVDSDSDPITLVTQQRQSRAALSTIDGNRQKNDTRKKPTHETGSDRDVQETGDDEDEDSLFLPRGRLAAQLHRQASVRAESSQSSDKSQDENAYARIKKRLLSDKAKIPQKDMGEIKPAGLDQGGGDVKENISHRAGISNIQSGHTPPTPRSASKSVRSSPGLFLTPDGGPKVQAPNHRATNKDDSDTDLPADTQSKQRFFELVARKKAEREAKQAAEEEMRKGKVIKQRAFERQLSKDNSSHSDMSDEDRATDKRLTQQSRPTRKASKKAIEEISRETQRMSRNMQLAHQAKTKKKITKDSLFARFNFRTSAAAAATNPLNSSSTVTSSAPASDIEETRDVQSPPPSPIEPDDSVEKPADASLDRSQVSIDVVPQATEHDAEDLPDLIDIMSREISLDKGKGKAVDRSDIEINPEPTASKKAVFTQPAIRVRAPKLVSRNKALGVDLDSDLEVMPAKKPRSSKVDVFDRLPAIKHQGDRSLQTLRALAHLGSPGKQASGRKSTMSLGDMQTSLQRRARQQAVEERAAKIDDLKSRGIVIQTAEERQHDQAEVEDMIQKARREGDEIMQKEKRAAKKARIANGEVGGLPDTSDEDDDYEEGQGGELEVELSESEEGEGDDSEGLDELASDSEESGNEEEEVDVSPIGDEGTRDQLVVDEASEDGDDEGEGEAAMDTNTEGDELSGGVQRSRRKRMVIDDDDDDDDQQEAMSRTSKQIETPIPGKLVSPENPFGFNAVPMGMTQAFAATMADTQTQGDSEDDEQDSLAMLDSVPEPNFPIFETNDSMDFIEDSQADLQERETNPAKELELHYSQSQIQYDALGDAQEQPTASQISEIPDPTQDVGFASSSPAPETRFRSEPPSTVDTVLLSDVAAPDSPVQKKRGRLLRRGINQSVADEHPRTSTSGTAVPSSEMNAFDTMRKARKAGKLAAAKEAFDKKKSEAKGMVEEQAQESEDEYAGLGGASDEDSGEEDEDVKAMMDHGEVNVDEGKLAGFYADRERASDEKAVAKLYKDINSGMLRKKRGADFDLSDSDDDAEARKKRKRIEFAKMRKALLADENVGKIAQDPKKLAFLQSIEDRNPEDDFDFLDLPADDSFRVDMDTQEDQPDSQSQQPTLPTTAAAPPTNKRKRPLTDSIPDSGNMRPPATARRTAVARKPATLAEIRESVSFLIEDPGAMNLPQEPSSSASEDENPHVHNPRRAPANPIIDRLSLKRAESTSTSASSRLAFHDPTSNSAIGGGFKVPSLLRRATTNQLSGVGADANGISTAAVTERAAGGGEKGDFIRKGGGKRISVTFGGREKGRSGVLEGVERRRKEERERAARETGSGLGGLGWGSFE